MKPHQVKGVRKAWSHIRETGACLRSDCTNRNVKCDECFRHNGKDTEYKND